VAAIGLAGVLVASCQAPNSLGGSVSELFPLAVSHVQVLRNSQAFQVTYLVNDGTNVDIVVQLTMALQGVNFTPGQDIPLAGEYQPGHQRTSVIHLASGEPEVVFPQVHEGDLKLTSGGNPGQDTRGNFSLSFINTPDTGGGRTLNGSFEQTALDAGYGPGLNF
jgi:hypothetical protein